MEPLHIEWKLAGGWSPPARGLHLDGLVARAVVDDSLESYSEEHAADQSLDYERFICALPFEKFEGTDGWCWKASLVQPVGKLGMSRRYLTGKTPELEMALAIDSGAVSAKGSAKIDTMRNHAKNSALTYPVEHALGLEAWCIGDKDGLEELLGRFTGIGVKNVRGNGTLLPFEDGRLVRITQDETAHVLWKRRNLPTKLLADDACYPGQCSITPPYWKNQDYGWIPV